MDRRGFLKTTAAALAAFILPAPRPRIDLMDWCSKHESFRFDMKLPWLLDDWTYATEARACIRVRPESGDRIDHEGRMPPFGSLTWDHDSLRGWKELRPIEPIRATDSECPQCEGTGYKPNVYQVDCPHCDATGWKWINDDPCDYRREKCRECNGCGHFPPCEVCSHCKGNAIGIFPSLVLVDGHVFDAKLYRKVQSLGAEAVVLMKAGQSVTGSGTMPLMRFRFDGGTGLLVGMDPVAKTRIVTAQGK